MPYLRTSISLGIPPILAALTLSVWFSCIPTRASLAAKPIGQSAWSLAPSRSTASLAPSETLSIHDIQGAGHISPYKNQMVGGVQGVVTAIRTQGFYMQEPFPDDDPATSEGIFIYLGARPSLEAGDGVSVTGVIEEEDPFSLSPGSLSVTRLTTVTVQVLSSGLELPDPVLLGLGGRVLPGQIIEDDASSGNVETSGDFDPITDGIDFYESLEGMLVQVMDPIAVSGTSQDGVIAVVGDGGALAGPFTPRGGLTIQPDDFNPERIQVEDVIVSTEPRVNVGAAFGGVITGVIDYSMGNFKLYNILPLPLITASGVVSETAARPLPGQLSIASFNTENLDFTDSSTKFAKLARQIVHHLKSPDILALEEIQDNSGALNDNVVTASLTYARLVTAIQDAGGPRYQVRQIDPEDGQDGGAIGGNIRVGFLFREDRGLSFVDHPGGNATTPVTATLGASGIELSINPGRVDPTNPAFEDSRKPLAGEFTFYGQKLIVIACHFNSKSDDSLLFGRFQPPLENSRAKRSQQAAVVNAFVQDLLGLDPQANVIVLGDFNDYPFSPPMEILAGTVMTNLLETLPTNERYTYVYEGNSQALDQILVNDHLLGQAFNGVDIVHINAEFADAIRPTDHDPVVARFSFEGTSHQIFLPSLFKSISLSQ